MMPWTDRAGKFSPLKAMVFAGLFVPAIMIAARWATGQLGPRPVTEAIHQTGDWAIRLLFISLAVTPLRRIADWPKLIVVRRMIGLAALSYALAHFCLYVIDQNFNLARVASEIALRIYLTIGFAALIGLSILGATSTDAAIRKLGRNWNRLHKAGLRYRHPRRPAFFHADQGRRLRGDLDERVVRAADGLPSGALARFPSRFARRSSSAPLSSPHSRPSGSNTPGTALPRAFRLRGCLPPTCSSPSPCGRPGGCWRSAWRSPPFRPLRALFRRTDTEAAGAWPGHPPPKQLARRLSRRLPEAC